MDPRPVVAAPSIFCIEEVHIYKMNIINDIKYLEKNSNQKPFWRKKFETYTRYLIFKGNPFNVIGDRKIIIVASARHALF